MNTFKIVYGAATVNMGDTTETQAEYFRDWAQEQIEARFPEADVTVSDADEPTRAYVYTDDGEDIDLQDEAMEFCAGLWDRAPWPTEWMGEE